MKKVLLVSLIFAALSGEVFANQTPTIQSASLTTTKAATATSISTDYNFYQALSIYGLSIYAYEEQLEEKAFQRINQNVHALLQQQERELNQRFTSLLNQQLFASIDATLTQTDRATY